jgi:hypothetical protein
VVAANYSPKTPRPLIFFKSFGAKNTARGQRNFLSGIHLYVCKNSYIFFRRNYGSGNFSLLIEFQKTCRDWHILCYQEFHVDRPIPTPDSIAAFEKMLFFSHGDLKRQGSQKNKLAVVLELKAQRLCRDAEGRRNRNGYHSLRGWERDGVGVGVLRRD